MATIRLPAVMESLHEVQGFVVRCAEDLGAPPSMAVKLELVMEELAVNVISYAYAGVQSDTPGEMEITCTQADVDGDLAMRVDLRDWGAPFNPLEKDAPDTDAPMDERPIGGLGILLVTEMTDAIGYSCEDGANILTVFFKLNQDVSDD